MNLEEFILKYGEDTYKIAKFFYSYCLDNGGISWVDTYEFAEIAIRNDFQPFYIQNLVTVYHEVLLYEEQTKLSIKS